MLIRPTLLLKKFYLGSAAYQTQHVDEFGGRKIKSFMLDCTFDCYHLIAYNIQRDIQHYGCFRLLGQLLKR